MAGRDPAITKLHEIPGLSPEDDVDRPVARPVNVS
jgi:hypothetical protein